MDALSAFMVRVAQIEVRLGRALAGNARPRCILLFESRIQKIKAERANALSAFMVRVARLELAASWSQTRRPTNWATPGDRSIGGTNALYTKPLKNATRKTTEMGNDCEILFEIILVTMRIMWYNTG